MTNYVKQFEMMIYALEISKADKSLAKFHKCVKRESWYYSILAGALTAGSLSMACGFGFALFALYNNIDAPLGSLLTLWTIYALAYNEIVCIFPFHLRFEVRRRSYVLVRTAVAWLFVYSVLGVLQVTDPTILKMLKLFYIGVTLFMIIESLYVSVYDMLVVNVDSKRVGLPAEDADERYVASKLKDFSQDVRSYDKIN